MTNPIVEIEEGKLKGKVSKSLNNNDFYSFKGIPYAKPPIGEMRFAVPEPPESWEGVRDASLTTNICAQLDKETGLVTGSEDCLYLNVYTPKLPDAGSPLLPAMVFFHGGGFLFGSGTDDAAHGPEYLIDKDVIIVSLNYRLGILGFLSLNRKDAPGNMGLRDMVRALQWIQKNISKFGGDPDNVTIFGISAGGASVEYLLLSPLAKGLFHKAIAQSGSSLLHWAHNEHVKDLGARIPTLKGLNITDDNKLLEYLKGLTTEELILASMAVLGNTDHRGGIYFGFVPTIEKRGDWEPFLDQSPYRLLSRGEFNKVPYMGGFCTREGLLMVPLGATILNKLVQSKAFAEHLPFEVDPTETVDIEKRLKSIYLQGGNDFDDADAYAVDFFTDVDFLAGIYVATKLLANKNNCPVYFYEFAYDGNLNYIKKVYNVQRRGACHGDDGGYLITSAKLKDKLTELDKVVRERMLELWTNFAKLGDPTPHINKLITAKWKPITDTGAGMPCYVIGDELSVQNDVYPQRMKFYEELYEKTHGVNQ